MSHSLASLRQLLAQPPSWELWNELNGALESMKNDEEQTLAIEYTLAHLDADWFDGWRQGNQVWQKDAPGWLLVKRSQKSISSLAHASEVWIPPTTSFLGCKEMEGVRTSSPESPTVPTTLTYGYWMQTTSVTQGQWQQLMGSNPSSHKGDLQRPVERVSWYDAIVFCNALSRAEGLEEAYTLTQLKGVPGQGDGQFSADVEWKSLENGGYRLPTEAEWELACRAGSKTERYLPLEESAWNNYLGGRHTCPVGQKKPNAWGLYDMLGNVYDWCWDLLGSEGSFSSVECFENPWSPHSSMGIYRGGNFASIDDFCRAGFRCSANFSDLYAGVGFRVCRTSPESEYNGIASTC